ncbi:hypothetical protein HanHA300_Chr15g0563461 [Helianthus annuus]|nr:hypothetical protein HanHA300_Chr15g0563461 [Helianthus annuus]KAJ0455466.1 hypothetical protein HanIR_Chr15g0751511 [Helianthus annuus]KAJ0472938.1 hypothetical protein HanHA89_Chr15g0612691 [Helianthus annuus]KAJ0648543.1 hypothetical protein HanLR1_Chr15g0574091 [Helianthus annuus]
MEHVKTCSRFSQPSIERVVRFGILATVRDLFVPSNDTTSNTSSSPPHLPIVIC